ncbi:hypothetical protein [Streptomyces sp. NPDC046988]|uniref:hypothetical protein n=1 Tax=Streptomyces sp. NPDC046988 TaxID=3154922 RepID=UPI0033F868DF
MYVLVPDDPVFFAKFQSLEEPLLRRLYQLHSAGLDCADGRIISDAYDSWVQVLLKLPLWSDWHAAGGPVGPEPDDGAGYVLLSERGDPLTSLYPIEVTAADLGHLTACLELFAGHDRARLALPGGPRSEWAGGWGDAPAGQRSGPPEREGQLTDVFRRVMEVLLLPPPQGLLAPLMRQLVLREAAVAVILRHEQETEYRRYCEDIVTILSAGDNFAYRSHRALYF